MDTSTFMYIFGGIGLAIMVAVHLAKPKEIRGSVWETLTEGRTDTSRHSPEIVCPHCTMPGHTTVRTVKVKKGVSGGKATAALLTGGTSLLATGLSRKESETEAMCSNCGTTWHF